MLAKEAVDDKWKFTSAVYGWGSSVGGETSSGTDIDIGLDDILENLDLTVMANIAAHKGKWSFMFDVIYLNVDHSDDTDIGNTLAIDDIEITSWVVTPLVSYNVLQSDKWLLNVLAGARYLYMKTALELKTQSGLPPDHSKTSASGDFWDGIIGIRGEYNLNQKWYLPFHFDIGTGACKPYLAGLCRHKL